MRKRKYLIGATLALAMSIVVPAAAHAAVTGQTLTVKVTPIKQQKKVAGPSAIDVVVATQYTFPTPAGQTASNTVLDFDRGLSFFPGNLADCNPTSLANTTTAQADAVCGKSRVGSGDAILCSFAAGCVGAGKIDAIVSAYNGTPSGGNPTILLHTKTNTPAPPTVLTGVLIKSPVGGKFGNRLDVTVPDTTPAGVTLTNFHTNVPKKQTKPKKKKNGKVVKPAKFYVMAKCLDKVWDFQETTTFRAGGGSHFDGTTQPCKQKPAKKKK